MISIYLAGGAFEIGYRSYVNREFGNKFRLLDPIKENGAIVNIKQRTIERGNRTDEEIVCLDKALIQECDIFIAYINKYSAGTMMEIIYAYERNKPIYLIVRPGGNFENDIWLKYHATKIFFEIDECFKHILNQIEIQDEDELKN